MAARGVYVMACFRLLSNCFLLMAAVIALSAGPAMAAIDKAGAEKLKAVVEKAMAELGNSAEVAGKTLELDGPIMVEPSGTYYAVTLPGLKYGYMDGAKVEMGMIAINAMPASKPGQWKMTLALPTPLSHFDDDQQLEALTTIGAQSFAGIWSEELNAFVKLNATYQNVVRMNADHKPVTTIKSITVNGDSTQSPQGAWSGDYKINLANIAHADDKLRTKGSMEALGIAFKLKNYSPKAASEYDAKLAALAESYNAGEGEEVSVMHMLGVYNLFSDFISSAWQGVDMEATMNGVAFSGPAKSGRVPQQLSVQSGRMGFGLDGLGTDKVTLALRAGYDGMTATPAPPPGHITPEHMNVDISINNLPLLKLMALGRDSLQMTAVMPSEDIARLAILKAIMMAPQALTEAQSNVTIRDTRFGNGTYDVKLSGVGMADLKALYSATAKATVRIRNIQALAAGVKAAMSEPGTTPEAQVKLQKLLQALTIMQVAGRKEQDENGAAVHAFDVELGQDGKVMLNGTDLSALLIPEETKAPAAAPAKKTP